jgi:hypothetical protein
MRIVLEVRGYGQGGCCDHMTQISQQVAAAVQLTTTETHLSCVLSL